MIGNMLPLHTSSYIYAFHIHIHAYRPRSIVPCVEYLPNVVSPAGRETGSGREQEMSRQGLMGDRK